MRINRIQREEDRSMLSLIFAFLCAGALHILFLNVPYTTELMRILFGTAALFWVHSIRERITHLRVQRLLTGAGLSFMLLLLLQACKYCIFYQTDILRNLEYAYYVPIILIPLLVFEVSLYLNVPENKAISPLWHWLWLPSAVLILLFLTNDLHQWVFYFPGERSGTDASRHMPGYWAFVGWGAILLIAALGVFIRKCRLPQIGSRMFLPLLPVVLGIVLLLSMLLFNAPRMLGARVWNIGEIYVFMGIGFMEACIRNGLIPSNQHYQQVFSLLSIPARIESTQNASLYATAGAHRSFEADEDRQLNTASISGGCVSWLVDLKNLHRLDRELQTTVEQLENRNSILQMEAAIREETEQHDTRNRIYSNIAQSVRPQLEAVEKLLSDHPQADPDTLAHIAVLNAYIKRRGNLELLARTADHISSQELMLAIRESLIYTELCGVEAYADCSQTYSIPSARVIEAYAGFEKLLESLLDDLLAMAVYAFADSREVRLRINCRVKGNTAPQTVPDLSCLLEYQRDMNDLTITLGFSSGGDAPC